EHAANSVDRRQQGAGNLRVEGQLTAAQPAEQALGGMGHGLQLHKSQKAGSALDGVQRAEDTGQRLALGRFFLQLDEIEVELREVLVRLEQEFADDLIHDDLSCL